MSIGTRVCSKCGREHSICYNCPWCEGSLLDKGGDTDENQLELGLQLKREGMELAADNRREVLDVARAYAIWYAERHGEVHADDVANYVERMGLPPLGPAAGSVFAGKIWRRVGMRATTRRRNHARLYPVWALRTREGVK